MRSLKLGVLLVSVSVALTHAQSLPTPVITSLQASPSFGSSQVYGPAITSGTSLFSSFALIINGNFNTSAFKSVTWTNNVTGVTQDFGLETGVQTIGGSQIVVNIPAQGTNGSLFGTAVSGVQNVSIVVTEAYFIVGIAGFIENDVISNAATFTLNPPLAAPNPTTLPAGTVGVPYSATIFTGGTSPYTVGLAEGSTGVPPVALSNSPTLSGTPQTPGLYTFTLSVQDEWGNAFFPTETIEIVASPTVTSIVPNTVAAGTNGIVVTVNGTNFVQPTTGLTPNYAGTVVYISPVNVDVAATPLATTVISPTQAQATLPASLLSTAQAYSMFVVQPSNAASNRLPFTVVGPTISAVSPSPITARPTAVAVTVTGTNYLASGAGSPTKSTIVVNGTSLTTTVNSNTSLSGSVILSSAGTAAFQVMNPGGSLSNTFNVTVLPTPTITSVTPNPYVGGTITVNGTNFTNSMTVLFNGTAVTTGFVSATRLTAAIPANLVTGTSALIAVRTADGYVTPNFTLPFGSLPTILTASLPQGNQFVAYDAKLAATGGTSPYVWNASGLPQGLSINTSTGEISGTPQVSGTFNVVVTITDSNGLGSLARYSLVILAPNPPPQINTGGTLPVGFVGVSYNVSLTASGGNGTLAFGQVGGLLPPGLVLDSTGILKGLPTTVGTYTFSVSVTDSLGFSGTGNFTLQIKPQPLAIITSSPLPPVTVGGSVNVKFTAFGGVQPYTFTGSGLPPGTSLATDGTLSGTATQAGTFNFTVTVSDNGGSTPSTKSFSLTVTGQSLQATGTFPDGQVGVSYAGQAGATGGSQPYVITVTGLPDGVTFNNGTVGGTPTTAGKFTVTVSVSDKNGITASQTFSVTIAPATLVITTASLPDGTVGVAYSAGLAATGGTGKLTWTIGGLPGGVTATADGAISGTPNESGPFTVTASVSDTLGAKASKSYSITINAPGLVITTNSLANGTVGVAYSASVSATGGIQPLTFSASGLPGGLSMATDGSITGTPTAAGTSTVVVTVKDKPGTSVSKSLTLTVVLPTVPTLTVTGLPTTGAPSTQSTISIGLGSPFPVPVTVNLTLTFAADSGPDDPNVQFSSGGRTATLTIPAGATAALTSVGLQTGTVAGLITITAHLTAGGQDVTPTPAPVRTVRINSVPPVEITVTATATSTGTGFTVTITGFATARKITSAIFTFTPAAGVNLQTTSVTIPVDTLFSAWYSSTASTPFGSQFIYTQPFTVTGGSNAVASVTVTLVNADGSSVAVSATVK
jgi:hypothetical protein